MKKLCTPIYAGLLVVTINTSALAQTPPAGTAIPVTVENFTRAETDRYFAMFAKEGTLGKPRQRRLCWLSLSLTEHRLA